VPHRGQLPDLGGATDSSCARNLNRALPYDSDALAEARLYRAVPLEGSLWWLKLAERDWRDAVRLAERSGAVPTHPDRGEQSVEEVVRGDVHDAVHHDWDIVRSVGGS
jgi:hypothetical protein